MTGSTSRTTVVAVWAAPVLMLASTVAYLANGQGLSAGTVAGTVQIWAFAAYGVAIVGLAVLLDDVAARAATAVRVLGILGVAGGAAYGLDSVTMGAFGASGQDVGGAVTPLALRLPGLAFPLALAALGVLLARHRLVPAPAAWALVAAAILFPASRIPDIGAVAVASDVLALLAMGAVGAHLLGHRAAVRRPAPADPSGLAAPTSS
jgi:hypothetical protein